MFDSLRHCMTWLHTWFGLFVGYLLFVIFFFGTLSVFDREIDRWALPDTRFEPQIMPSFDNMLAKVFEQIEPEEEELIEARKRIGGELPEKLKVIGWGAYTTHRDPVLDLYAEFAVPNPDDPYDHVHGHGVIDPRTGKMLPEDHLKIGSHFFYPMHYSLHIHWKGVGYFVVGFAALMMLMALVSGVVIHRKLFKEFFTFRPQKKFQRSALDMHNLTGVVALPFHFAFAFTGLTIFAGIYFPFSETTLEKQAFSYNVKAAEERALPFEPTGERAVMASVDAMVAKAKSRWEERGISGEVGYLWISHLGDKNAYVSIYRAGSDRVANVGHAIHFQATTGNILYEEPPHSVLGAINEYLTGLHLQHFEHWLLRWFYVFGGLLGTICIATGFIFFVEKRKKQHERSVLNRYVDATAVAVIAGSVLSVVGILLANRLLPMNLENKGMVEEYIFWAVWLASFAHAFLRSSEERLAANPAWREQVLAIAIISVAAVVANWVTTGDHLLLTLSEPYWPVAGVDLSLLSLALISAYVMKKYLSVNSIDSQVSEGAQHVQIWG